MHPYRDNSVMTLVHAVLIAERFKTWLHWIAILFHGWLMIEVIWYFATTGAESDRPISLDIGAPLILIISATRIIGRLRRGF